MGSADRNPIYNLKAVVRETGVRPETLRAWERRYGLPRPSRTPGGHRLYSRRDIEIIRWILDRQAEGLSVGQAVALWRALEAEGKDPLRERSSPSRTPLAVGSLEELRDRWVEACLRFSETEAEVILAQAMALYPPEQVFLELIGPAMGMIGDLWYRGKATVQQEHFASALAACCLNARIAALPPPTGSQRLIVGCPPRELHALPALLLVFLLRQRGWPLIYLGPDVPLARLEEALREIRPHLVVMTAQMLETAATLADVAEFLCLQGVPLAYGGRIFQEAPSTRRHLLGFYLGDNWAHCPERIADLLADPHRGPEGAPLPAPFREALAWWRDRWPSMEVSLRQDWEAGAAGAEASEGLGALGRAIEAALRLGDPTLLHAELAWIRGLLLHYGYPLSSLAHMLRATAGRIRAHGPLPSPVEGVLAVLDAEARSLTNVLE